MQGDAIPEYQGTCVLTSIANLLTQANLPTSEAEVVQLAIDNRWAVTDPAVSAYQRGGSNYVQQQALLGSYGLRNALLDDYDENALANMVRSGRGVLVALNCGRLWDDPAYLDDGGVNHVVTVTGMAYGEEGGALEGFYIADSGRQKVSDMTRFVSISEFRTAAAVPNAYAIYTKEALKFWNEDIDGRGNSIDNILVGNRGNNVLDGSAGSDTLYGGAGYDLLMGGEGGDTYVFNRGDGMDRVREYGNAAAADIDVAVFGADITRDDLWFRRVADDLEVSLLDSTDSLLFEGWYARPAARVEVFQAGDGFALSGAQIDNLVSAMAAFAPPVFGQPALPQAYQDVLAPQIAASWR